MESVNQVQVLNAAICVLVHPNAFVKTWINELPVGLYKLIFFTAAVMDFKPGTLYLIIGLVSHASTLISNDFLWTTTPGQTSVCYEKTYTHISFADTEYCQEYLPRAIADWMDGEIDSREWML